MDDETEVRYRLYLETIHEAIGLPVDAPWLHTDPGIELWSKGFKRPLAHDDYLCKRLSRMVRRMLRVVDYVSGWPLPLGPNRSQDRDPKRGQKWIKELFRDFPSLIQVPWGDKKTFGKMEKLT